MEVITFDHEVFKALEKKIDRIADYVLKKETAPEKEQEMWLTSEEVADLLKISTRTLQRMRTEKSISYSMVRNKCIYRLSDIEKSIHERTVTCQPKTLDEFKRNYLITRKSEKL